MEKLEHNVTTDEVNFVELTDAELEQHRLDAETLAEKKAEFEAAAATKIALLERLSITAEEAETLLS
jgi:hypothetical protein